MSRASPSGTPRFGMAVFGSILVGCCIQRRRFSGVFAPLTGVLVSALATYYAGRALPSDKVKDIAGDRIDDVSDKMRSHGVLAVAALRFLPTAPYGVEGMIVGTLRVKLWEYLIGTALGMGPGCA